MLFSQRKGLKTVKNVMQVDSMDIELRTALWNGLTLIYWQKVVTRSSGTYKGLSGNEALEVSLSVLWDGYFRMPVDSIPNLWAQTLDKLKTAFFKCEWYEVYDFVEFIANNYADEEMNQKFIDYCNVMLRRDVSGYRFVGGKITEITSEEEINAIEEALEGSKRFKPVHAHLGRALELLSDRKVPDYRNSIKESISAVEAICKLISGDEKATLGQALKIIESKIDLHSALKKAFDSLYGYTSNADGIRHALLEESNLDFEDAKFMMVSCSAFINYLISKSAKAGIAIA